MSSYKVWEDIDELSFYEDAIILEACARSQTVGEANNPCHDLRTESATTWERHLLDDFALVAAGPGGPTNVAAACLELGEGDGGFVLLRIAKNESFDSTGIAMLSRLVQIMNETRAREITVLEGQRQCFDIIAEACHPRMIRHVTDQKGLWQLAREGRLHLQKFKDFVHSDFQTNDQQVELKHANRDFVEMLELVEALKKEYDLDALKQLAGIAFKFRHSNSLRGLLPSFYHLQGSRYSNTFLERLEKLARFFRAAITLGKAAADAYPCFRHIRYEAVPSICRKIDVLKGHSIEMMKNRNPALFIKQKSQVPEIARLVKRWKRYVVHAEMLLVIFYEENPRQSLATKYIGISKRSCFLCANFIRAHDYFAIEGHHGQLYCLWTLPETINFESYDSAISFKHKLKTLQQLLAERKMIVSRPFFKVLNFAKESVANFSRVTLTIRTQSLERVKDASKDEDANIFENEVSSPTFTQAKRDSAELSLVQSFAPLIETGSAGKAASLSSQVDGRQVYNKSVSDYLRDPSASKLSNIGHKSIQLRLSTDGTTSKKRKRRRKKHKHERGRQKCSRHRSSRHKGARRKKRRHRRRTDQTDNRRSGADARRPLERGRRLDQSTSLQ